MAVKWKENGRNFSAEQIKLWQQQLEFWDAKQHPITPVSHLAPPPLLRAGGDMPVEPVPVANARQVAFVPATTRPTTLQTGGSVPLDAVSNVSAKEVASRKARAPGPTAAAQPRRPPTPGPSRRQPTPGPSRRPQSPQPLYQVHDTSTALKPSPPRLIRAGASVPVVSSDKMDVDEPPAEIREPKMKGQSRSRPRTAPKPAIVGKRRKIVEPKDDDDDMDYDEVPIKMEAVDEDIDMSGSEADMEVESGPVRRGRRVTRTPRTEAARSETEKEYPCDRCIHMARTCWNKIGNVNGACYNCWKGKTRCVTEGEAVRKKSVRRQTTSRPPKREQRRKPKRKSLSPTAGSSTTPPIVLARRKRKQKGKSTKHKLTTLTYDRTSIECQYNGFVRHNQTTG